MNSLCRRAFRLASTRNGLLASPCFAKSTIFRCFGLQIDTDAADPEIEKKVVHPSLHEITSKEALRQWHQRLVKSLEDLKPDDDPLEVPELSFDKMSNAEKKLIPDYIYSSTIQTLLSKDFIDEAMTVLIQAHLNNVLLDIGTYEYLMRSLHENNFEPSFIALVFTLYNVHFTPSKKILKILRAVKLNKSSTRMSLLNIMEDQLRKKGIDPKEFNTPVFTPHAGANGPQPATKQKTQGASSDILSDSVTLEQLMGKHNFPPFNSSPSFRGLFSSSPQGSPSTSATLSITPDPSASSSDLDRFSRLYSDIEGMINNSRLVVIMPRCFTFKDKDGNPLFTIEDNDYSEGEEYTEDEDQTLTDEEPEEGTPEAADGNDESDDHGNKKK